MGIPYGNREPVGRTRSPPAPASPANCGEQGISHAPAHSLWAPGDGGSDWTRVEPNGPTFDNHADEAVAIAWLNDQWIVAGQGRNAGTIWIGTPEE